MIEMIGYVLVIAYFVWRFFSDD